MSRFRHVDVTINVFSSKFSFGEPGQTQTLSMKWVLWEPLEVSSWVVFGHRLTLLWCLGAVNAWKLAWTKRRMWQSEHIFEEVRLRLTTVQLQDLQTFFRSQDTKHRRKHEAAL